MANIIISDTVGKTEEFKRPDHPDFASEGELRKQGFSGVRYNELSGDMEIWLEGERKVVMTVAEMVLNPAKWDAAYADVFGLYNVKQEKEY